MGHRKGERNERVILSEAKDLLSSMDRRSRFFVAALLGMTGGDKLKADS